MKRRKIKRSTSVRESTAESVCVLSVTNTYYASESTDPREILRHRMHFRKKAAVVLISLEISQIGTGKEIFDSEVFDR
jgi:hypothetical protein